MSNSCEFVQHRRPSFQTSNRLLAINCAPRKWWLLCISPVRKDQYCSAAGYGGAEGSSTATDLTATHWSSKVGAAFL